MNKLIQLIQNELSGIDHNDLSQAEINILNHIENFKNSIDKTCDHSVVFQYRKPKDKTISCKKCEEN